MKDELVLMKTFVLVVELGNFSAAARALGIRQSSVSRRVAELETGLEVALLVRTTRDVRTTEAGRRYYEGARAAIAAVESARAGATDNAAALSGTLRVGCCPTFADRWLAPRLPIWLEAHPGMELEFVLSNSYVDLVEAGVDTALRFGGPDTPELRGLRLKKFPRILVASPAWVEVNGSPSFPDDLQAARWLVLGVPARSEVLLHHGDNQAAIEPLQTLSASTGAFLQTLACHHVGPFLLPSWLAEERLTSGELVQLLPGWEGEPAHLWVVWPNHKFQPRAARMFVEWVTEQIESDSSGGVER